MSLPNFISLGRLFAVPVVVWLILGGHLAAAFWLFVAAGVSDGIDGFLAKRLDAETTLGRYLDPLADKALLVSVYLTLGSEGYLADWLVILVVFRDALIVAGSLLYFTLTQRVALRTLGVSKLNTVAQIVLVSFVLAEHGLALPVEWLTGPLVYATAATTLVSGAVYVVEWTRRAAQMEEER